MCGQGARLDHLIAASVIVGVKELFEPLDELEVVLEPALDQAVHRHDLGDVRRGLHALQVAATPGYSRAEYCREGRHNTASPLQSRH